MHHPLLLAAYQYFFIKLTKADYSGIPYPGNLLFPFSPMLSICSISPLSSWLYRHSEIIADWSAPSWHQRSRWYSFVMSPFWETTLALNGRRFDRRSSPSNKKPDPHNSIADTASESHNAAPTQSISPFSRSLLRYAVWHRLPPNRVDLYSDPASRTSPSIHARSRILRSV